MCRSSKGLILRSAMASLWLLPILACTPDLQETVGPIIHGPNVTGTIVRDGVPVGNLKVKLEITDSDSMIADDRTDTEGRFAFTDIGVGDWTIRADSSEPTDFNKVTFNFVFLTADSTLEAPALDVSLDGLRLVYPEDNARLPLPRFTNPITFEWERPNDPTATLQAQVAGPDGKAFWYSDRTQEDLARWNGVGNRGENMGKMAAAGSYRWRVRVERPGSLIESSTTYRLIEFTEEG